MDEQLTFAGRTVVVTGAGRNLGREYALAFAARGANVVVNDLGVGISDSDGSATAPEVNPADEVVAEIIAAGGAAVANHDSISTVDGGESIIETAISSFGGVDVVVNNAGQVRMAAFGSFPESGVDDLIDTQLRGTLNVSRPAWRFMERHGGGRFVNVSSGAAFGGVPEGSVYAMAKMGVIGLTRGMAGEGAPLGITANVIVPYAKTRPGTGFGPIPWSDSLAEWLHPRLVAPLVLWLGHGSCPLRGETIAVGGGWAGLVSTVLSDGYANRDATPEDLAAHIDELCSTSTSNVSPFKAKTVRHILAGFDGPGGGRT